MYIRTDAKEHKNEKERKVRKQKKVFVDMLNSHQSTFQVQTVWSQHRQQSHRGHPFQSPGWNLALELELFPSILITSNSFFEKKCFCEKHSPRPSDLS